MWFVNISTVKHWGLFNVKQGVVAAAAAAAAAVVVVVVVSYDSAMSNIVFMEAYMCKEEIL